MQDPANRSSLYQKYCTLTGYVYKLMNFICVMCLAVEIVSVTVMVTGRYVFNKVPLWCDQMSLMALVWMAIISVTLSLYDENHMRVELIDKLLPKKAINVLKYFSNAIICVFSALMVRHGITLVDLNKSITMSGFRVSQALLYLPLVICGLGSVYMCIFCIVRRVKEGGHE